MYVLLIKEMKNQGNITQLNQYQKKHLTAKDLEDLIREVEIFSTLNHSNIIKFYETYHDKYYFHIVMELCSGKEIFEKIVSDCKISETMVSQIITKVLRAVSYCH